MLPLWTWHSQRRFIWLFKRYAQERFVLRPTSKWQKTCTRGIAPAWDWRGRGGSWLREGLTLSCCIAPCSRLGYWRRAIGFNFELLCEKNKDRAAQQKIGVKGLEGIGFARKFGPCRAALLPKLRVLAKGLEAIGFVRRLELHCSPAPASHISRKPQAR